MIKVDTRYYSRPSGIFENVDSTDRLVVLILHSGLASQLARDDLEISSLSPDPDKTLSINAWMTPECTLVPSVINITHSGRPEYAQGRHRAIMGYAKKYDTYPVITLERFVPALKKFWGSMSGAHKTYDLTTFNKLKIFGNP